MNKPFRITSHWEYPNTPAVCGSARGGLFSRVRKVLKSVRKVEAVPPGVADHITLGIPQYASGMWQRTSRIVPPGCAKFWRPAGLENQKSNNVGEVWRGEGLPTSQKPKEFIAFLTSRRRGLCAGHLPAMYGPCTPTGAPEFGRSPNNS